MELDTWMIMPRGTDVDFAQFGTTNVHATAVYVEIDGPEGRFRFVRKGLNEFRHQIRISRNFDYHRLELSLGQHDQRFMTRSTYAGFFPLIQQVITTVRPLYVYADVARRWKHQRRKDIRSDVYLINYYDREVLQIPNSPPPKPWMSVLLDHGTLIYRRSEGDQLPNEERQSLREYLGLPDAIADIIGNPEIATGSVLHKGRQVDIEFPIDGPPPFSEVCPICGEKFLVELDGSSTKEIDVTLPCHEIPVDLPDFTYPYLKSCPECKVIYSVKADGSLTKV